MSNHDNRITEFAYADALVNVFQPDARVESVYGPRPELDGAKNSEQGKHIGVLNERHILGEVRERTKALIDLAHDRIGEPLAALLAKGGIGVFVEVAMATLALFTAGVPFPENLLFGSALAAFMFALVGFTRHSNKAVRYLAITVMIILAIALTAIRMDEVGSSEDSSFIGRFALPVILLLGTFGIALMTEPSLAKLRSFWPDWRKARAAQNELAMREARDAAAQAFTDDVARQQEAWDGGVARGKALYISTWKSKRGEVEASDPTRRN